MRAPARKRLMEGSCLQRRTLLQKRLVHEEENLWMGDSGGQSGAGFGISCMSMAVVGVYHCFGIFVRSWIVNVSRGTCTRSEKSSHWILG